MKKFILPIIILLIAIVPTFFKMLKPGIFSTQDFHFFRLYEFDKCIEANQVPCRWAPDAGLGYGEPLFNFYTQLPYAIGEIFHKIGFSLIDSLKATFILSLILSGLSMFVLAKRIWKSNIAAITSSILYVYAPYRAVDVWVRGALPEALSFIFFPWIIYFLDKSIAEKGFKNKLILGLTLALTLLNHNLSLLMFAPFIVTWSIYRLSSERKLKSTLFLFVPVVVSILLSAFYILPVIFESKYVDINSTTIGYFDFRAHFVTIPQLLISRFWGYGGSTWGDGDGLNLSIGQIQWILPLVVLLIATFKKKLLIDKEFLVLFILGWFYLFMTHNKSSFIWEYLPFMKYLQFPWRFLSVALFSFSLSSGFIVNLINNKKAKVVLAVVIGLIVIALNFGFFKEDIWYNYTDKDLTSGEIWDLQRTASIGDFWPLFGHKIPNKPASGEFINYFPGWNYEPNSDGLIPSSGAYFSDTPVRKIGNIISLLSLIGVSAGLIKLKNEK